MYNKFPRVAIIGDTGEGKTVVMTAIAYSYYKQGYKIFSNYELKDKYMKWEYLDPKDIATLMFKENSPLHDCVILTDEAHMDLGKHSFYMKPVQDLGDFATQTRKRRIIWLYTTQVFGNLVKTVRDLTTNFIYCKQVEPDFFRMQIHNRSFENKGYIKTKYLEGKPYYKMYDTGEIISKTIK